MKIKILLQVFPVRILSNFYHSRRAAVSLPSFGFVLRVYQINANPGV